MMRRRDERAARILEALDRNGGWMYSLDISEAAGLADGSISPELARLYHDGWIERQWNTDVTPPRRWYRVKPR
jgi:DNA-binding IclR family transcriptional regulator